jgi:ATP-dependent helicase HrpB
MTTADPPLPVTALLEEIHEHLASGDSLLIEAPPGAGKTTIVPLSLLEAAWLGEQRIVMLQPRRLAARNAAQRMAELLGEEPGATVGYRMRLDTRVSAATRIEVVTEGVLLRMLRDDPSLDGIGALIFDEIHERSLEADLGLALALYARRSLREGPPLRIIAMSATLAMRNLQRLLDAPCVRSEGRLHPVDVSFLGSGGQRERIAGRMSTAIEQALSRHPHSSVLAFLPGQGEIRAVAEQLRTPASVSVEPLYGDLGLSAQRRAIAPSPEGQRKVVLATNIAETSLTIDGIDVVVDAGLERRPVFDPNTGMTRLTTARISRASAEQRCGRAGRLRPGTCYRLWSEAQHAQFEDHASPEIAAADLAPLVLQLFAWGIYDPDELDWQTAPPPGAYAQALELLIDLAAVERGAQGLRLTPAGAEMAELPVHPRLGHMLLAARAVQATNTATLLAAILSERDPLTRDSADMRLRLDYLRGDTPSPPALRGWLQRCRRLAQQIARQLPAAKVAALARPTPEQLTGYLLACAYPDRIARQRHSGGYQLANGRSAAFDTPSSLSASKWLAVAEVGGMAHRRGDSIRSAAPLDPGLFETLLVARVHDEEVVDWDERSGRFIAERRRRIGALTVGSRRLESVSDAARTTKLLALIREARLANLHWSDAARALRERAVHMQRLDGQWPGFDDDSLIRDLDVWLAPFLGDVRKLSDLRRIDLVAALGARLSWSQREQLDRWLPEKIQVPSGSRLRVDYGQDPPVLAVKLQEMFGCEETPVIADGRLALRVHLLSPAGRPLQITQDLAGFWRSGYADVRRDMRGRYPKHPWPEDPLTAAATAGTRRRRR